MTARRTFRLASSIALSCAVALLAATASARPGGGTASGRIIGGKPAASFPAELTNSVVAVADNSAKSAWDGTFCTGVLAAPLVVVTARHCVEQPPYVGEADELVVVRGRDANATLPRRGWDVDQSPVVSVHRSPGLWTTAYDLGHDIAVLRLAKPLATGVPAQFARPGDDAWWGGAKGRPSGAFAAGWGSTKDGDERTGAPSGPLSAVLNVVELPIVGTAPCAKVAHLPAVSRRHICAGLLEKPGVKPRTACHGDSGGPLFAADPAATTAPTDPLTARKVVAITAYGEEFECAGGYGHFTRVDTHFAWIDGFVQRDATAAATIAPPAQIGVAGTGKVRLTTSDAPGAVAATKRIVLIGPYGGDWMDFARVPAAGGAVSLPPTRTGKLKLRVRSVDAGGVESASSAPKVAKVRVDRAAPRLRTFTATALGNGRWGLAWSRPVDDDRVIAFLIQKRKVGTRAWQHEYVEECAACWNNAARGIPTKELHLGLPGKWQFRISVFDRALNQSRWVVAR